MHTRKKKKRIFLVVPSLHSGGMERVMSVLANFLSSKENIQVYIILYGKNPQIFYDLNLNIIVQKPNMEFDNRMRFIETIRRMKYLRRAVLDKNPCCVLSFGTLWNRFVLLSLFGVKIPVFISNRGNPMKKQSAFQELLAKILYPKAAGVIAQTKIARDIYVKNKLNKNVKVIPNPVITINSFVCNREKLIVSVGRLITTKHFDRLIHIFQCINRSDWKLIIVGGDALKQKNSVELQKLINNTGLNKQIVLTGAQKNVENFLLKASIFAFTSSSEGFPNVIGEAMSAGLPVVAYDCVAGPSDMIEDGKNGYLIPVFDDEMFEKRLRYLMENEVVRIQMGTYAKESIQKFSIESIGEQYLNFITSK